VGFDIKLDGTLLADTMGYPATFSHKADRPERSWGKYSMCHVAELCKPWISKQVMVNVCSVNNDEQ